MWSSKQKGPVGLVWNPPVFFVEYRHSLWFFLKRIKMGKESIHPQEIAPTAETNN
jgi:hypothetical protein